MGTWTHWVLFNIPGNVRGLTAKIAQKERLTNGAIQGVNDSGNLGWNGPYPPSGTHRYYFKIYALDIMLDLQPGATKNELLKAMEGHILAEGQLMARYKRTK
jgi:hypothetical protein